VNLHCIFIFWIVGPTSGHVKYVPTITRRTISNTHSNYSDTKIYDMLLPLNTLDEFLILRFIDVKRIEYKDP
jgi:hypothetical protein